MKRGLVCAVSALVVACQGNPPPVANHSPSSPASAAPSAEASAGVSATPAPDRVSFSCRLPVVDSKTSGDSVTLQGGFITFPQATYAADPGGAIHSENVTPQDFVTTAKPYLHGTGGGAFYDAALKRWIPVGRGQASPDGRRYAYEIVGPTSSSPTQMHIANVADGSEQVVGVVPAPDSASVGWEIVDFDGTYVYLAGSQVDRHPRGVWRLTVADSALLKQTDATGILLVQNGYAWVGTVNSNDPSPPIAPKGEAFDSLARVDLRTGVQTTWIYRAGQSVALIGLDASGHPIVSVASYPDLDTSHGDIRLLAYPGDAGIEIASGIFLGSPQADIGRIWFADNRGIYLFTPATRLLNVFAFKVDTTVSESITPVGYCR